jgi:hypothetical protein
MSTELKIQKALEERIARAASRGFTREYQEEREHRGNTISHRALAPVTLQKYEEAALNWALSVYSQRKLTILSNIHQMETVPQRSNRREFL